MILKDKKVYLAGPMEFDIEHDWRTPVIDILVNKFGLDLHDPSQDEKQSLMNEIAEARSKKDHQRLEEIFHLYSKKDYGTIDRSDLVIAFNPRGVCTTGTPCEVKHSLDLKKPTLVVCPEGKEYASLWYYGLMKNQYIFGSWDDLYAYLNEVCEGKHNTNHRWMFALGLV